jgi:hypothetical protein
MKNITASDRKGKVKPKSHFEPYMNIRNAMSKAAGMLAIRKRCLVEHMHSEDEVGLFLFGWHSQSKIPQVVTTKEGNQWLRDNNVSLSKCQDPNRL